MVKLFEEIIGNHYLSEIYPLASPTKARLTHGRTGGGPQSFTLTLILWYLKNKLKCGLSWSVLLSTTSTRHYSFPKHFFALFLHVERVCKSFRKESLTRFKSESVFFNCRHLDKDFFRYLWYSGKKNRMSFSVALVKFHWFGINQNAEIVACI